MANLEQAIKFIRGLKHAEPGADKARVQEAFAEKFTPERRRSVFVGRNYAIRFSEARTGAFSNTVLSLSALQMHDQEPFVVVVVRERSVDFLLSNSTFLRKISHSSHQLRSDNIKGSFNGTDIFTEYEGIPNTPGNFEQLFALHSAFTWRENVERLVEATNGIVGRDNRFKPTEQQRLVLLDAANRAAAALVSSEFQKIERELISIVESKRTAILAAAAVDNVNLRGNAIEQLITGDGNAHELGDVQRKIDGGVLVVDIKTKLLDRASAPKAYNIDKMLAFLAQPGSVFAFLMVGVDTRAGTVTARLFPIFESSLLDATGVQHHWAGRSSRGVTQLSGRYDRGAAHGYRSNVDIAKARAFIELLVNL